MRISLLKVADALDAAVVLSHWLVILDTHPEAERQLGHAPDKHDLLKFSKVSALAYLINESR